MKNSILVAFGTLEHGWLPVNFKYTDFNLNFDASDGLNDPIEELYNVITKLQSEERSRVTFWLEPGEYYFDFERNEEKYTLTIIQVGNLDYKNYEQAIITTITGNRTQIIEPFQTALKKLLSTSYEEIHWSYTLDKAKFPNL
ncbi:hypothetical protein [Sphingobacterium hungaricum]|uniref:Uncharacterized protein n=1 Tax=Sphingobacterium hungaricum TaxID=2082723 RepID=A0A928UZI2_9SPHI|nr:hypothetical protein [Sphingobacterium hungaricum]MBE8715537.1 hypothetical protein [Sphingobacterium hungaricum]